MVKSKERKYRVHFYEIDYKKRIMPSAIINYLQDIAIVQSEELGLGIDFLAENHMAWSLIQWDINIHKYPVMGQKVKVFTRPVAFEKVHAYREFLIHGQNGDLMVDAYSLWILKDIIKKRIIKIPPFMFENYGVSLDTVPTRELIGPKDINRVDVEKKFLVRYSDIDTNRHVNNVKYLEWAVETMPVDTMVKYTLRRIRIRYKKSTLFGDEVKVMTEINQDQEKINGVHKINNNQGQTVCLLETIWTREEETPC